MAEDKNANIDELVVKAQNGDKDAFGEIYDALVKQVYRYIYYKVDDSIAEDLTEETFFKAWQNLGKYKKGTNPFASWVFRIAHNLVIDHYRKSHAIDEIDEAYADPKETGNPVEQTNIKLTNVRLRKIIKKLPDNYQQVIILKYINELENNEIADTIGKSEAAVRIIQFRALEKLRSLIGDEGDLR